MLFCRGQQLKVKGVTGGGTKHGVYEGRDLIAFDSPFHFNSRKVHAFVCPPVLFKAKRGYLPRSVLQDYEPVTLKFTKQKQAKRFGNLEISSWRLTKTLYAIVTLLSDYVKFKLLIALDERFPLFSFVYFSFSRQSAQLSQCELLCCSNFVLIYVYCVCQLFLEALLSMQSIYGNLKR